MISEIKMKIVLEINFLTNVLFACSCALVNYRHNFRPGAVSMCLIMLSLGDNTSIPQNGRHECFTVAFSLIMSEVKLLRWSFLEIVFLPSALMGADCCDPGCKALKKF